MACHGSGVVTSKVCADCHPGGFTIAHPAPPAAHTAPTGGCVKAGCHVANVATVHTTPTAGHPVPVGCDACHSAGVTPRLTCTNAACHGAGAFPPGHPAPAAIHTSPDDCTDLCHFTNVATQHTTATEKHPVPPGCVACHDTGVTASLTCATCHSSGTYHQQATAAHFVSNSCNGSSCHNNDVSVIHVKNSVQKCVACHAAGVDPSVKGTDCAQCHSDSAGHPHPNCTGCHPGSHYWGYNPGPLFGGSCSDCHGEPFQPLSWGTTWNHPGCNEHCHTESSCDCH
jgi:hypothetical protein